MVLRVDFGSEHPIRKTVGGEAVAGQADAFGRSVPASDTTETVLINGTIVIVRFRDGQPLALQSFTISGDQIVEMSVISGTERLVRLGL